nr:CBL-interacting serine/threonine-protein kinase 3-like isoform X1 [Ipomoea batatas]
MRLENIKAGRKGNLNVATEVFQVAPSLHMVEVRKAKGDTLEFHKVHSSVFFFFFFRKQGTLLVTVISVSYLDFAFQQACEVFSIIYYKKYKCAVRLSAQAFSLDGTNPSI